MFSIFKSDHAKLRDTAKNWLYLAGKVYHFRKDKMSEGDARRLLQLSEAVKSSMKSAKEDSGRIRSAVEDLKDHIEHVGGNYYPRGAMAENVEFFLVAIIIYVGFTTFFIKPFKIPTNSMWPTYHGMTGQVYEDAEEAPGVLGRAARFVALGATHYGVKAPVDGELLVPVYYDSNVLHLHFAPAKTRRYFVFPTAGKEYYFYVGGERVGFKLPWDFVYEREIASHLGEGTLRDPYGALATQPTESSVVSRSSEQVWDNAKRRWRMDTVYLVRAGLRYEKGESILHFDLHTGDQLFVDRMSYHFVEPKLGDGFVFKTGDIPRSGEDKFYIKRLAGLPGDSLAVVGPTLMVNGVPAAGAAAFDLNAERIPPYGGYVAMRDLGSGLTVELKEREYYALGDNSANSADSRFFGPVPASAVVGRPILIYYPFSKRFGVAK